MKLTAWQTEVAKSPKRFRTCICGRRAGKTFLAVRELCYHARIPNRRVWYIAPTRSQAKGLVWDQLKDTLSKLNWIRKVNESDLSITLCNGSVIELRSGDAYDRMRGYAVDFLVMDEFADIDPDAWTSVCRATLSDRNGKAMFISTPKGRGNWAYDIYNKYLEDPDNWASWQVTTESGGNVPLEEIEAARQDLDERTYLQEYCASFVQYSGVIYYNFDRNRNVKPYGGEVPNTIHVGIDMNVDPMSATIGVQTNHGFHVIDYLKIFGSNTNELAEELRRRYPTQKIFVYPDASGRQRRSSAGGMTDHIILQNAGFILKVASTNPAVKDRIAAVNSVLKSSTGSVKLYIDPKCKPVIESLERQTYKEGTQIPSKDDGTDHQNDATGYVVHWLYPVRRDLPNTEPGNWRNRQGNRL